VCNSHTADTCRLRQEREMLETVTDNRNRPETRSSDSQNDLVFTTGTFSGFALGSSRSRPVSGVA